MNNPKRLAEILLEHICAQEYGKSEKVFEQHKAELEAMLKNWVDEAKYDRDRR
jgi:hypothetical protein